jgi:aspartyl-tRNA synthetase
MAESLLDLTGGSRCPKNNSGRDVMLETPAPISDKQLKELGIIIKTENHG